MGRNKKDRGFVNSAILNNATFDMYFNRFLEVAMNIYEWKNLPEEIDHRFLELTLATKGKAVFFKDEGLGEYLALNVAVGGAFNVYNIPTQRRAYASNGYQAELNEKNSVLIYNNYMRTNEIPTLQLYAMRLYEIERAIDVNVKGQKTPKIIKATEDQRLTMLNLFKQYDGNEPFIFGDSKMNVGEAITAIDITSPYVADSLMILKQQYINEVYNYYGVSNSGVFKRARVQNAEVEANKGTMEIQRNIRLDARKEACEQINKMFGLNMDVEVRENVVTGSEELFNLEDEEVNIDE